MVVRPLPTAARIAAGVAALGALVLVGAYIGGGAGTKVMLVAIGIIGVMWSAALLARVGMSRLATFAFVGAAFFAPMNDVRPSASFTVSDVFLLMLTALVLVQLALRQRSFALPKPASTAVLGGLMVLTGGLIGTLVGGQERVASLLNIARFGVAAVGTVLVVVILAPKAHHIRAALTAWIVGVCISVFFGVFVSHRPGGRSMGLSTHPNHLGLACALSAPIALAFVVSTRGWRRVVAVIALGVTSFGVVDSGSRAALLGYLVAMMVVTARAASPRLFLLIVSLVAVAGLFVMAGLVNLPDSAAASRILDSSATAESDAGRDEGLVSTIRTVEAYPLTGIGFEQAKRAHNIYLQSWASAGLLGLAGLVLILVTCLRSSWNAAAQLRRSDWPGAAMLIGLGSGIVAFVVASLFQNVLWDRYLWFYVSTLLAAVMAAGVSRGAPDAVAPLPSPQVSVPSAARIN